MFCFFTSVGCLILNSCGPLVWHTASLSDFSEVNYYFSNPWPHVTTHNYFDEFPTLLILVYIPVVLQVKTEYLCLSVMYS